MANKIILKRGADANVSSLSPASIGEPIWGTTSNKLYVASGTSAGNFEWVGATILDEDTMSSDSATKLATQQSIKAYVDAQDANIASDSLTFTNKTFDVEATGNSISNIDVADLKSGVLDTDISSVSSSHDTVASAKAIKTYIDAEVTAQGLDFSTDTGTGAVDLDSQTLSLAGGEGMDVTHSGQAVTIAGENATNSNKGVASFSSADFDVTAGAVSINSVGNSQLDNSSITVTDGTTGSNVSLGGTVTFSGTSDEVEVSQSGGTVTIGLPNNVTIGGNLTVNGTTTTIESTNVSVDDVMIELAKDNSADSVDFGMYGQYNDGQDTLYSGWFRNQDGSFSGGGTTYTDAITFYQDYSKEAPGTTDSLIDTTHSSYSLAPIECSAINGAMIDGGAF
jgi:hypothetical protein